MKKYEGYVIGSKGDWAVITEEDIAKYPKRYESYTMYCSGDDITIIWALTILCMPDKEVEIERDIIDFMYGNVEDDPFGSADKYIQTALIQFVNQGIKNTKHNLLFSMEDYK